MIDVLLQAQPWYWRFVDAVQRTVDTRPEQQVATVGIVLVFLLTVWFIYLGGKPLKRRFSTEAVEIARTVTIMGVALLAAALVVVVWRTFAEVEAALRTFGNTLVPEPGTATKLFVAFIVVLGTYALTRASKRVVRYWSENGRISPHQRELSHHAIQLGLFFVAILFIFVLFKRNPGDLFIGAGALGLVLGFAARKTLADVLAGFVILFGRPFEAGDWVSVGERQGIVTEITIFNTQVQTFNEEHVLIPNDSVMNRELVNYSKTPRLRITTDVGVDYDADVATAATVATEAMEGCDSIIASPEPDVVVDSFADSAVVLRLRYWIDDPTIQRKLTAQNEVIDAVKTAFEEEGIKIPYPQRELTGREEADGLRITGDGEMTVGDELERAVQRVGAESGSTDVAEPVEERYGDDGGPDDAVGDTDGTADGTDGSDGDDAEPDDESASQPDTETGAEAQGAESRSETESESEPEPKSETESDERAE